MLYKKRWIFIFICDKKTDKKFAGDVIMTKEKFKNYNRENTFCDSCKQLLPTKYFSYSYIRDNGTASRCKCCDWIRRNNGIPNIDGYSKEEIISILEFILFDKSIYINDLANNFDLSIEDTIRLVQQLKIGNKKMYVKSNCTYCGKEIENTMSVYMKTKHLYCSSDCYWKHKPSTIGHGKDNWQYNRIKTNCTYCGKEIEVIPYNYNLKNSFGENHNFCSQNCYWKYRSKHYVGDKSVGHNRIITEEQKEKMKLTMIKNCRSAKRFDSKIQLLVNSILDKNNISYKREHVIKYYALDNYLTDSGLIIEVMGDYWHTSPLKYNENKYMINEMQQRGLQHDKQKHTYIKNHHNIEILYLWEHDIEQNLELCEALILEYIRKNGILENYHSFNWNYENETLSLNKDLIIPYQDMKTDEYRHLIKKKVG